MPNILIDKGVTLQNMGKLKLAIRSYDKALDISPDNIDALLNKGSTLHSDEKYPQAIECYDSALKIDKKMCNGSCLQRPFTREKWVILKKR